MCAATLSLFLASNAATLWLAPADARLRYSGRHTLNASARFDWVGTGFTVEVARNGSVAPNATLVIDMAAPEHTRFEIYKNGGAVRSFYATTSSRTAYAVDLVATDVSVTLLKTTEPAGLTEDFVELFRVGLPSGFAAVQHAARARPWFDVYGDSDTAAYGIEASPKNDLGCVLTSYKFQNFARGWLHVAVEALRQTPAGTELADPSVQAISGIGVTRNAGPSGPPLPALVRRSLQTVGTPDFPPPSKSRPTLVIIYLGSNDYVFPFPPSDAMFTSAYKAMVAAILSFYGEPHPPVLHICASRPALQGVPCRLVEGIAKNATGAMYSSTGDAGVPKGGCIDHRNTTQQAALGSRLAPVIARAAGWDAAVES